MDQLSQDLHDRVMRNGPVPRPEYTDEPLPHWCVRRAKGIEQFAALATRDGRKTGNGVVVDFEHKTYNYGTPESETVKLTKIVTDAGNIIRCTDKEVEQLFYGPQWIMRDLLPAHVQALKDELFYGGS